MKCVPRDTKKRGGGGCSRRVGKAGDEGERGRKAQGKFSLPGEGKCENGGG
jgi:hypothetical protein